MEPRLKTFCDDADGHEQNQLKGQKHGNHHENREHQDTIQDSPFHEAAFDGF